MGQGREFVQVPDHWLEIFQIADVEAGIHVLSNAVHNWL